MATMFSAETLDAALERPWHQRREADELPRSWSEEAAEELPAEETDDPFDPPAPVPEPGGDVTGTVYPLDESVSGAASA